ncbi:MAG: MTAP family purine nucleoside phosphorylase [Proteobacteria bacterium]|nr:MTAP family purine nucleoside phosphorylase [Pseudomonadota bacterium]
MKPLGIISGTIFLHGKGVFANLEEKLVENEFGKAIVFVSNTVAFIPRHGKDIKKHILPHLVNHQANMQALKDLGVEEVVGINSTGSLKMRLKPGMLVVPDDFIKLSGGPTIFSTKPVHITPVLSEEVRQKWLEAAHDCGIDVVNGGVYWQTSGPRLETKAEIRMISMFADLVGMTMASEAVIAEELDMSYAALCSVDNYGHGLQEKELTMEKILWHARRNVEAIVRIITRYIERRKG